MSKPKWANIHLTLEQALNVLDIDRQLNVSYASDKRGAIHIIRKALEEKGAIKTKYKKQVFSYLLLSQPMSWKYEITLHKWKSIC